MMATHKLKEALNTERLLDLRPILFSYENFPDPLSEPLPFPELQVHKQYFQEETYYSLEKWWNWKDTRQIYGSGT
jgi:hypothetical protein